jgi:hypothetical protein
VCDMVGMLFSKWLSLLGLFIDVYRIEFYVIVISHVCRCLSSSHFREKLVTERQICRIYGKVPHPCHVCNVPPNSKL